MPNTGFFDFAAYLAGLAFLWMAWTNSDFRNKFRLHLAKTSVKSFLWMIILLGFLVLIEDLVFALDICSISKFISQPIIQFTFSICLMILVVYWVKTSIFHPPTYNKNNHKRFYHLVDNALAKGDEQELKIVSEEIARCAPEIIEHVQIQYNLDENTPEITWDALRIVGLLGNDRFCAIMVRCSVDTVVRVFMETFKQRKPDDFLKPIAKNFITQSLKYNNSFAFYETDGGNGLISRWKPVVKTLYSDGWMLRCVPELLEPDYELTSTWNSKQINAYCNIFLHAFKAYFHYGCDPFVFHRYFEILERVTGKIYLLNNIDYQVYESETYKSFRHVIFTYQKIIWWLSEQEKPGYINKFYTADNNRKDILDFFVDSIDNIIFSSCSIKTSYDLAHTVQRCDVWDITSLTCDSHALTDLLKIKLRRKLYLTMKENFGVRGINVLLFLLFNMSLSHSDNETKHYCRDKFLHKMVVYFAKRHLLEMYQQAKKWKSFVLPDYFSIDEEKRILYFKWQTVFENGVDSLQLD